MARSRGKEPSGGRGSKSAAGRLAILTSGGDAPGMNAAIRSVVRSAWATGIEVLGSIRGFEGLVHDNFRPLNSRSVANIIQHGGTMLETSRCGEFRTRSGRAIAARNLKSHGVDAVVALGGEGTMAGALKFSRESGIRVMVVPASIDNDVPGTEASIGFDTAVNTAVEAVDRIRDTALSHERVFFVEVMGRDSGFIGLEVALAGGAESVILPELRVSLTEVCRRISESERRGKRASIVVVSEGSRLGGASRIAAQVSRRLGIQVRAVILGYIQRGGAPCASDRMLASRMGAAAVRGIAERRPSSLVAQQDGLLVLVPLDGLSHARRPLDSGMIRLVRTLSQ